MYMETDKELFFQSAHKCSCGDIYKCLHFIPIFTAQKLIIGMIIQYISLNNIKKIFLNPTGAPGLEFWAVLGL
jgi:hypothetical protein